MQFLVISHQLWEMLLALCIGVFLGLVYDLLRFVRRLFSPLGAKVLVANIFDTLFGIFCAVVYCIFLYYASNGRFRWFTALFMIAGFALYRLLPSRLILPFLYFLADRALSLVRLLVLPISLLKKALMKCISLLSRKVLRKALLVRTEKMRRKLRLEVVLIED